MCLRLVTLTLKKRAKSRQMPLGFVSFAVPVTPNNRMNARGGHSISSSTMNLRTATVLEVDQDVQTAPSAARGILIAAGNLRAAAAADLLPRAAKVAAVAAAHAAAVDGGSLFPEQAIAAARAERLLGIGVPRELGGEGAGIA